MLFILDAFALVGLLIAVRANDRRPEGTAQQGPLRYAETLARVKPSKLWRRAS